ncbi:MAG: CBS domain-containing protein [Candidatus Aureabacteria bacterium]|nr:CBS domain-containing protein [Candidatus Auribacterota bacterium]
MIVGEIMTANVVTINMDSSLRDVSQILSEKKFHHLLVVKDKKLMGVISDRDFIKYLSPFLHSLSERDQDRATLNTKAHQIMTRNPITVLRTTPIDDATKLLLDHNISCLPVISDEGNIEGIVTWKDFLKWSFFFKI